MHVINNSSLPALPPFLAKWMSDKRFWQVASLVKKIHSLFLILQYLPCVFPSISCKVCSIYWITEVTEHNLNSTISKFNKWNGQNLTVYPSFWWIGTREKFADEYLRKCRLARIMLHREAAWHPQQSTTAFSNRERTFDSYFPLHTINIFP